MGHLPLLFPDRQPEGLLLHYQEVARWGQCEARVVGLGWDDSGSCQALEGICFSRENLGEKLSLEGGAWEQPRWSRPPVLRGRMLVLGSVLGSGPRAPTFQDELATELGSDVAVCL